MWSRLLQQNVHRLCVKSIHSKYFLSSSRIPSFQTNTSLLRQSLAHPSRSFSQSVFFKRTLSSSPKANTTTSITSAFALGGTVAIGLGLASLGRLEAQCDAPNSNPGIPTTSPATQAPSAGLPLPQAPKSSVNIYELSFGTVCGICAGVFVKKGAKTVAFLLGGIFVILQYFGSISMIRVNWSRFQTTFENMVYHTDGNGVRRAPTIYSFFNWIVNFLTADFPPRATFLAGFVVGLRIG